MAIFTWQGESITRRGRMKIKSRSVERQLWFPPVRMAPRITATLTVPEARVLYGPLQTRSPQGELLDCIVEESQRHPWAWRYCKELSPLSPS